MANASRWLAPGFDYTNDVWRFAPGGLVVANPEVAREVMGNKCGGFVETSDFFHTRRGVFGPRDTQIKMGRAARALVHRHLAARGADLPRLVSERLAPRSAWPDAGNLLIHEHLREVLVRPGAPEVVRQTIKEIVNRAVLAGARSRHSTLARLAFRRRAMRVLGEEIQARRRVRADPPRDLLDVVATAQRANLSDLAEVYLSFLFATVGSIGFALGWSVYLAGTHATQAGHEPEWIVREALRMWPVAWLFARVPSRAHELAGVQVHPGDQISVCTYLVHRHPHHWEQPEDFLPQRWAPAALPERQRAFLPFGFGPHTCTGATVAMALLEEVVRLITQRWHLSVTACGGGPHIGPALAPPSFTAHLLDRLEPQERR
jgi:cytochrome P450